MKCKSRYIYCICRISKNWKDINPELKERGYKDIKCFVPTLSLVKKIKNKKDIIEEVPMLFNYAFVKMKREEAFNRNFLFKLQREIPDIVCFVKSLESMHPKRLKRRVDNAEDFDDFSKVAIISKKEVRFYKKLSKQNHIFNLSDIASQVGEVITLKGYPFDGMLAKVLDFNYTNHTAIVEIYPGMGSVLSLQLPLEMVFYTIYQNYNEENLIVSDSSAVNIEELPEEEEPIFE